MARDRQVDVKAKDLQGFGYLNQLQPLLQRLHDNGLDKSGNRQLFFDQYVSLLLLYFFNPIWTSLNGLQQATRLAKVQELIGGGPFSLGALSAAQHAFDPALLEGLFGELVQRMAPRDPPKEWEALKNLVAVDGSLLPGLPRMTWALWQDEKHRAAKMHVQFEVLRGVPVQVDVTAGSASETRAMKRRLKAGLLYVVDRGYADYQLFQDVVDAKSSLIGRIRENAVWQLLKERPISAKAAQAGVQRDLETQLGCQASGKAFKQPMRVVEVNTGRLRTVRKPEVLLLATDRFDLEADLVALGYRFRWSVELFFRWIKRIIGLRHLLCHSQRGVTIQVYVAFIASLLISRRIGHKPTKRTYEMICLFFQGLASEQELEDHITRLHEASNRKPK
jgi:Transposase DDE domain